MSSKRKRAVDSDDEESDEENLDGDEEIHMTEVEREQALFEKQEREKEARERQAALKAAEQEQEKSKPKTQEEEDEEEDSDAAPLEKAKRVKKKDKEKKKKKKKDKDKGTREERKKKKKKDKERKKKRKTRDEDEDEHEAAEVQEEEEEEEEEGERDQDEDYEDEDGARPTPQREKSSRKKRRGKSSALDEIEDRRNQRGQARPSDLVQYKDEEVDHRKRSRRSPSHDEEETEDDEGEAQPARDSSEGKKQPRLASAGGKKEDRVRTALKVEHMVSVQLRRIALEKLMDEPYFEQYVVGMFCKVCVGKAKTAYGEETDRSDYKVAVVKSVVEHYKTKYKFGGQSTNRGLTLSYPGVPDRVFPLRLISDKSITKEEFEAWKEANKAIGNDERMLPCAEDLAMMRLERLNLRNTFKYRQEDIDKMVAEKKRRNVKTINLHAEEIRLLSLANKAQELDDKSLQFQLTSKLESLEETKLNRARKQKDATRDAMMKLAALTDQERKAKIQRVAQLRNQERKKLDKGERVVRLEDPFLRKDTANKISRAALGLSAEHEAAEQEKKAEEKRKAEQKAKKLLEEAKRLQEAKEKREREETSMSTSEDLLRIASDQVQLSKASHSSLMVQPDNKTPTLDDMNELRKIHQFEVAIDLNAVAPSRPLHPPYRKPGLVPPSNGELLYTLTQYSKLKEDQDREGEEDQD